MPGETIACTGKLAGDTVIAEYAVSAVDPNLADSDSERILLTVDQPYSNPNGGSVGFGIDNSPIGAVFSDGFESGDTTAWSATVP